MEFNFKDNKGFALGSFILEFVQSIVLALAIFILFYLFVAQPNEVNGNSMLPNFNNKDYLLTDKLSYQFGVPKRGDVVVFKAPSTEPCAEDQCEYIKRIIGVPGDKIKVVNGFVYLNGVKLEEKYLSENMVTDPGNFAQESVEKVIPNGYYLCLGDNRTHSRDGREFGPIKKDLILGKAFFRYWPPKTMGLVPSFEVK